MVLPDGKDQWTRWDERPLEVGRRQINTLRERRMSTPYSAFRWTLFIATSSQGGQEVGKVDGGAGRPRCAARPHARDRMGHRTASSRDVTAATFLDVTSAEYQWLVLSVRVPAQPSRHRVAIWRELRRVGALSIGQGCWALPDVQTMNAAVDRVRDMAERGGGEALVVVGAGRTEQDGACLVALFTADRTAEWVEFLADCKKFDAEIDKEIRTRKFTLA